MNQYLKTIKKVLEESPMSRDCDIILIYNVHIKIIGAQPDDLYHTIARMIINKELPSYDTITRIGRKIKKESPHLRGKEYLERVTFKQEKCKSDLGYGS